VKLKIAVTIIIENQEICNHKCGWLLDGMCMLADERVKITEAGLLKRNDQCKYIERKANILKRGEK